MLRAIANLLARLLGHASREADRRADKAARFHRKLQTLLSALNIVATIAVALIGFYITQVINDQSAASVRRAQIDAKADSERALCLNLSAEMVGFSGSNTNKERQVALEAIADRMLVDCRQAHIPFDGLINAVIAPLQSDKDPVVSARARTIIRSSQTALQNQTTPPNSVPERQSSLPSEMSQGVPQVLPGIEPLGVHFKVVISREDQLRAANTILLVVRGHAPFYNYTLTVSRPTLDPQIARETGDVFKLRCYWPSECERVAPAVKTFLEQRLELRVMLDDRSHDGGTITAEQKHSLELLAPATEIKFPAGTAIQPADCPTCYN